MDSMLVQIYLSFQSICCYTRSFPYQAYCKKIPTLIWLPLASLYYEKVAGYSYQFLPISFIFLSNFCWESTGGKVTIQSSVIFHHLHRQIMLFSLVGINWNSSVCSSCCFWFVNADYFLHYFLSRFFKMPKQYIKETYSVFLEHYVSQKIEETYKLWSKQCTKMPCQILHGTRKWQVVRFCFTIFTLWIP